MLIKIRDVLQLRLIALKKVSRLMQSIVLLVKILPQFFQPAYFLG
jgi:hypothetical protein